MELNKFTQVLDDLEYNIVREKIDSNIHLESYDNLDNGWKFFNSQVYSQYIDKINQPLKIGLGRIIRKLDSMKMVEDKKNGDFILPYMIKNELIRLGEITREKNKTFAYVDKITKTVMGVVSDRHTYIPDKTIFHIIENFFAEVGQDYNMKVDHNFLRMRVDVDFPSLSMNLNDGSEVHFKMAFGNSSFGHSSLFYMAGFLRMACWNSILLDQPNTTYRQIHTIADKVMLRRFVDNISKVLGSFDKLAYKVEDACGIAELYIDEKTSLVKYLPENFNINVAEAEQVFTTMRLNNYQNNAFWTAQAIAEVGKTKALEDRHRLEVIAGQIAFLQV